MSAGSRSPSARSRRKGRRWCCCTAWACRAQVWQGIGRLLGTFARLVAPDLRGHGESDKPSAGYLPRDYVGDIAALVAHEPARPLAVIGHSLGAVVAALLAAERPELMSKVILLDPPFDASRPRDQIATVERLRHAEPGELEAELMRREPGMGELYAKALASLYRSAADGTFQAMLRAEPGFPAAVAALPNVSIETLVVAADPRLDAALGAEAAEQVAVAAAARAAGHDPGRAARRARLEAARAGPGGPRVPGSLSPGPDLPRP